jgi:hypothetical protein
MSEIEFINVEVQQAFSSRICDIALEVKLHSVNLYAWLLDSAQMNTLRKTVGRTRVDHSELLGFWTFFIVRYSRD